MIQDTTPTAADLIRAIAKAKNIKLVDLAARLGQTKQAVNAQLSRGDSFTVSNLRRWAAALEIHPAVLLGGRPPLPGGTEHEQTEEEQNGRHLATSQDQNSSTRAGGSPSHLLTSSPSQDGAPIVCPGCGRRLSVVIR